MQFREAAWLQPDIPDYWYCLGLALAQARDHAAAAESFQQRSTPTPATSARGGRSRGRYSAGRHAEAIPPLERVLRKEPGDTALWVALAECYNAARLRGEPGPC